MCEQVVIDSLDFARNAGTLRGKVAISGMARLQDALYSDEGVLEYALSGGMNEHGKPVLRCEISGMLQLICQRCLGAYTYPLSVHTNLVLVQDEVQLAASDNEMNTDAIVADPKMDVLALVEDEVLLALPLAPMHPLSECDANQSVERSGSAASGTFAALAALKSSNKSAK
jgi:uncharacterized protein